MRIKGSGLYNIRVLTPFIHPIAELQEDHLPDPVTINPSRRPFGVYNADAPWHDVIHDNEVITKRLENELQLRRRDLYFKGVKQWKKELAELEARRNRANLARARRNRELIEKSPEAIELERKIKLAEAEIARIGQLLDLRPFQDTIGPYSNTPFPDKLDKVLEKIFAEGHLYGLAAEDVKALSDPDTLTFPPFLDPCGM